MAASDASRSGLAALLDRLADLETRQRGRTFDALRSAVLAGETGGWKRFVEKHSRFVYSVALRLLAGTRDREEAASMIYTRTFERLRDGDYRLLRNFRGGCRFTTYLYRMVQTERKEYFLRERRAGGDEPLEAGAEPADEAPPPSPVLRPEMLRETVRAALGRLDAWERLLLLCRFRDGLKLREIAETFDLKDTNAAARALYGALERLDLLRSVRESARLGQADRTAMEQALREQLFSLQERTDDEEV